MTFDDAARARIATGWLNSSLDQPAYAAQHGISARTLRDWVCRYGGGRRPQAQLRAAIVASIEQLQNVLAALDAEAAADSAVTPEDGQRVAERHASSEAPAAPPRAQPAEQQAKPLSSSTTTPPKRVAGVHGQVATPAAEAADDVPVVPAPATVAVVDRSGEPPAPSCQARAAKKNEPRPSQGGAAACIVDLEAVRERLRQHRAALAVSGTRRQSFDWDAE